MGKIVCVCVGGVCTSEVNLQYHPQEPFTLILPTVSPRTWGLQIQLDWLASKPHDPPVSVPQFWDCKCVPSYLALYAVCCDSNSYLHASVIRTLKTKASSQS